MLCCALLALLLPVSSSACKRLRAHNDSLDRKLQAFRVALGMLQAERTKMEDTCKAEQGRIARTGASNASANSCVALKENAVMTHQLQSSAETCASQITVIKNHVADFSDNQVTPFEENMAQIGEIDEAAMRDLPECAAEFSAAQKIHEGSLETLTAFKAEISTALTDAAQFSAFGKQNGEFFRVTQAGFDRCGIQAADLGLPRPLTAGSVGIGPSPKAPPTGPSTVTGKIVQSDLPSGASPGQLSLRSQSETGSGKKARDLASTLTSPAAPASGSPAPASAKGDGNAGRTDENAAAIGMLGNPTKLIARDDDGHPEQGSTSATVREFLDSSPPPRGGDVSKPDAPANSGVDAEVLATASVAKDVPAAGSQASGDASRALSEATIFERVHAKLAQMKHLQPRR